MLPTRSPVLYVQITGRGVRPVYAPGYDLSTKEGRLAAIAASHKPNCMILDFGGVVSSLGPIDQISIRKKYNGEKESEGGEAIIKICPSCGAECAAAQRYCYACSYCCISLEEKAGNEAVMSQDIPPEWLNVLNVFYKKHEKEGKTPSMKVSYYTLQGSINEWVCFEHHIYSDNRRYAWNKAVQWASDRMISDPPQTIEDALNINWPKPSRIYARKKGNFYDILDYEFSNEPQPEKIGEEEYFDIPF